MAGFLSPATREQIRAASDIVDVIGSYLPLKHAGANFVALCPFHKEKTPSFNVNPQKQIFHCFGCHKGGDVFTFVKEYENIGFMDAVRRLAERAKIPLEFENTPGMQESRHLKDQLLDIHEQLTQRWQNCLASEAAGQRARDYLAGRGVSADAIKLFRIGAAPESWDDTVNWARSKNFNLATVEQAGLIIGKPVDAPSAATGGNATSPSAIRYYDRFRGRLMFPICNEQGHVVAFSGRVLAGDEKTAKYVNSPETPIFTKSRIFFGLDKSKRAILDADSAIICEGQLDLIACFMSGTSWRRRARPSPSSTRASSNATPTRSCCASIPTTPARTPSCARSTTCSRRSWPCAWPWSPRPTTRTASSRPTAARRSRTSSPTPRDFSTTC
jgi:DNA primase